MCGRYANVASSGDLVQEFDAADVIGDDLPPSWNIAPTDPVRAIVQRPSADATRQVRTLRWGLVPNWATDRHGAARLINARTETVDVKPTFRAAAARRRCLLPSLGYFEWQQTSRGKVPYFLHDPGGQLLAMAGLYEIWRDPARSDGDPERWLWTCTVITQPAADSLGQIHERNPVIVPPELRAAWLDCSGDDPAIARALLDHMPEAHLEPYVVSSAVGNVRNNGPELIQPTVIGAP